jgi:hypothetical protein
MPTSANICNSAGHIALFLQWHGDSDWRAGSGGDQVWLSLVAASRVTLICSSAESIGKRFICPGPPGTRACVPGGPGQSPDEGRTNLFRSGGLCRPM